MKKINFIILSMIAICISYSNCGLYQKGAMNSFSFTQSSTLDDLQLGKMNYQTYCLSCHGTIDSSTKRGRSLHDILNAINQINEMKHLNNLSTEVIDAISLALNSKNTNSSDSVSNKLILVKNRLQLSSDFKYLFLNETNFNNNTLDTNDLLVLDIIKTTIESQPEFFGSFCSRYDDNCISYDYLAGRNSYGYLQTTMNASQTPIMNTASMGLLINACERILKNDSSVNNLLDKVNLNQMSIINTININLVIDLIYANKIQDQSITNSIIELKKYLDTNSLTKDSNKEQWRVILLNLCQSPLMLLI